MAESGRSGRTCRTPRESTRQTAEASYGRNIEEKERTHVEGLERNNGRSYMISVAQQTLVGQRAIERCPWQSLTCFPFWNQFITHPFPAIHFLGMYKDKYKRSIPHCLCSCTFVGLVKTWIGLRTFTGLNSASALLADGNHLRDLALARLGPGHTFTLSVIHMSVVHDIHTW